jgi:predicted amidohydrolase
MILDFRGKVIANVADNNSIITASLSSDKLRSFRESFPVWKDFDEFELRNF